MAIFFCTQNSPPDCFIVCLATKSDETSVIHTPASPPVSLFVIVFFAMFTFTAQQSSNYAR